MQSPRITVVMPVWNGESYLREAMESILAQTFRGFEFLIVDDGSTDATAEILVEYAASDPRIRVVRLDHGGIVRALNQGVAEAQTEWVARMDSDDISHPTRLEKQWKAIQANPNAVLCHCHTRIIGDPSLVTPAGHFIRTKALLALRLCFQCPMVHPTVIFQKATFLECGGYAEKERHAEDYSLWGRLLLKGDVVGVAEPLLDFRVHKASVSKQMSMEQQRITERVAVRHCGWFMNLDEASATRAYQVFRKDLCTRPYFDWIWFVLRCLPRMRWQSLEMWAWVARHTFRRLIQISGIERPR
jgi:glycosyltransferase involved in cell wall biosynthesis